MTSEGSDHRAGFVALVGRPNAGKSTLLNQVLGEKVSIISNKPQTTRNRVVGIHSVDGLQAVLVDTPGIHRARNALNKGMVRIAEAAVGEVDAICWVVDMVPAAQAAKEARDVLTTGVAAIAELIERYPDVPLTVALNKVDLVEKSWVLPAIAALSERLPSAEIVPISALTGDGVERLVEAWRTQLPVSPPLFPADQLVDASERFVVAELVREKIFQLTRDEIPYATAVEVEHFEEQAAPEGDEDQRPRVRIFCRILVERDSQKGIIIGKGGSMLKRVGTMARHDIQRLLAARVHLDLHVSVAKDWTSNPRVLRRLGIE